ncbi:MAG: protein translocase subunit SecF [Candidatus Gottesmanbacteria bacterium]
MIRFSKYIWVYFLISSFVLVPGIYSLFRFGLQPSVDFTGGTLLEMKFDRSVPAATIESVGKKEQFPIMTVQNIGPTSYGIRAGNATDEEILTFQTALSKEVGSEPELLRKDTVGPILGSELLFKSIVAALLAIIAILLYVAYAFKNIKFGVSAIVALIHDVLVVFGSFSLFGHFLGIEVDTLFMTAFLTTMSFSVHDTIVIFDRIREYRKRDPRGNIRDISDVALNETMGRSLINSFTIIFMLLSLVLMGGETVKWFAVALLIGTITGTYSSPFVATPFVIFLDWLEQKRKK